MALHGDAAVLDGLADDLDAGYGAFVRAHSAAVYSAALRLSGSRSEADDLAQETFVRAYRALRRFDAERVLTLESRAWLLTITLNLWTAEGRVLVGLLRELPEHHRVPVVLRHVVGLSYAEISSVLECPVGTAKANVARGLDRLRALAGTNTKETP